jgi:hypothetical protein
MKSCHCGAQRVYQELCCLVVDSNGKTDWKTINISWLVESFEHLFVDVIVGPDSAEFKQTSLNDAPQLNDQQISCVMK